MQLASADNIGRLATICAAGEYYSFVNGWQGKITGIVNGMYALTVEQMEGGQMVEKLFLVPAEEVVIQ